MIVNEKVKGSCEAPVLKERRSKVKCQTNQIQENNRFLEQNFTSFLKFANKFFSKDGNLVQSLKKYIKYIQISLTLQKLTLGTDINQHIAQLKSTPCINLKGLLLIDHNLGIKTTLSKVPKSTTHYQ